MSVYIYGARRTPLGSFQGQLSAYQGWQLGAEAIKAVAQNGNRNPDEVFMGSVLGAGQGQAPARQAVKAAFPDGDAIPATTLNKVCGSGMRAFMVGCDQIFMKASTVVVAGGFESMTNAPYILPKGRSGYRMGHGAIYDHMMLDGLEDAYSPNKDGSRRAMGVFADLTAERYGFSRLDQENYVATGYHNYMEAEKSGFFGEERIALALTDSKGNTTSIMADEPPYRVKPEKFSVLRPAFGKEGTVTAATSSSIADGAAALLLGGASNQSDVFSSAPLARVVGYASYAMAPEWFTLAPVGAIQKLLKQIDWRVEDVDLFEINEAFAVVAMAAMHDLALPREKVNVLGGACTLGHPIGASGARVIVTLISALRAKGKKRGIAAVCIGGGEGTAVAIELID